MQTLAHIPWWVFFIIAALVVMGLRQTRTRLMRSRRVVVVNGVLTLLTLLGVVQLWRHTPWLGLALLIWAATVLLVSFALGQASAPKGARYDRTTHRFTVPGSWLPLLLYLCIFASKFVVGMLQATAPQALHSLQAAIGISAVYGLLSGLLNARTWQLWKLRK